MGWMGANYTVDRYFPNKDKEQQQVAQQEVKKEEKREEPVKTSP
jgi:hypothetical protein